MIILMTILTAALTLYAVFQILAPFFQSRDDQLRLEILDEDLRRVEELVAQRSSLLQSLKELNLDHETSKIDQQAFEAARKKLELDAVRVLRELDDIHGGRGWEKQIDQALSALRQSDAPHEAPAPAEASKSQQAPLSSENGQQRAHIPSASLACPSCEKELEADARFCSRCGHAFEVEAAPQHSIADKTPAEAASTGLDAPLEVSR